MHQHTAQFTHTGTHVPPASLMRATMYNYSIIHTVAAAHSKAGCDGELVCSEAQTIQRHNSPCHPRPSIRGGGGTRTRSHTHSPPIKIGNKYVSPILAPYSSFVPILSMPLTHLHCILCGDVPATIILLSTCNLSWLQRCPFNRCNSCTFPAAAPIRHSFTGDLRTYSYSLLVHCSFTRYTIHASSRFIHMDILISLRGGILPLFNLVPQ